MPAFAFDKILKIIQIIVTLLEMAVKAFTGLSNNDVEPEKVD